MGAPRINAPAIPANVNPEQLTNPRRLEGSTHDNIQIHGKKFLSLIARRGREVMWEQSVICSCWNPSSQQPNYNCKACGGIGFRYHPAIKARVLLTSITMNAEFQQMQGRFDVGDAVLTVPHTMYEELPGTPPKWDVTKTVPVPAYNIGMNDLVTVLDDDVRSSELLMRGVAMHRRAADQLLNTAIISVDSVEQSNPDTGDVTLYEPTTDYTLDKNRIIWVDGRGPAANTTYSVNYRHLPTFIVLTTLPKPRYQDGQMLPRYAALRYKAAGMNGYPS